MREPCAPSVPRGDSGSSLRIESRGQGGRDLVTFRRRTFVGLGLGIAVVAGVAWFVSTRETPVVQQRQGGRFGSGAATPVGLAAAAKGDIPIVLKALGTVTPLATV